MSILRSKKVKHYILDEGGVDMQNISDIIEEFLLSTIGQDDMLNISRNDLAEYFNCAPSQINYVLSTRFGTDRGFIIESQRGGGGYIKLMRAKYDNDIEDLINNQISDEISYKSACFLLENLQSKGYISAEQSQVISYALSPKALSCPIKIEDKMRSNIMKNVLLNILRN